MSLRMGLLTYRVLDVYINPHKRTSKSERVAGWLCACVRVCVSLYVCVQALTHHYTIIQKKKFSKMYQSYSSELDSLLLASGMSCHTYVGFMAHVHE